jgi:predicted phosphodiesterase
MILILGDWFDVMCTYGDPRSKPQDISSRYSSKDFSYLDMVIEDSIDYLKPYAANIAMISEGNHETKIKEKHDTDPLHRLVQGLRPYNSELIKGNYSGFVDLYELLHVGGTKQHGNTTTLHYHHGFGGSAPRSKGMLNTQLEAMQYPDADIIARGHTHQKWHDPSTTQIRRTARGRIFKRQIQYIQTGSYKDGFQEGEGGFEVEKNFRPVRLGGWWINLNRHSSRNFGVEIKEAH